MTRFALAWFPLVASQSDGNPQGWDRNRRCDHIDYDPPCGPCEGVGGYVTSDAEEDITIASCALDGVYTPSSRVRPRWGADITELKSHEILIGKKTDAACFQAFPSNDSTSENCYKPQECQIFSDMNNYRALVLSCEQSGNAWNILGNVSSVIYHQGGNMWITNVLGRLGLVNQCVCTAPREGGDQSKAAVAPVQFNWVDNLNYVGTEVIGVEYGVGSMLLDHWAFGPHHAWTDPGSGVIVRMWQPYNGLQIFEPGQWREGSAVADAVQKKTFTKDVQLFEQLSLDGSRAPDWCTKDAPINTFRIKCQDDGFPEPPSETADPTSDELLQRPLGDDKAAVSDLRRARSKNPRGAYKGDDFGDMSRTLNAYLVSHAPNSRDCDRWTVEELQELQLSLLMLRDPRLNEVYHETDDNRKLQHDVQALVREWDELNELARSDPDLARAHRDGHCHEAVMWYVHHLPEGMRELLKDRIALPLLTSMKHSLNATESKTTRVHRAYEEKVTCASCHSAEYPSSITV